MTIKTQYSFSPSGDIVNCLSYIKGTSYAVKHKIEMKELSELYPDTPIKEAINAFAIQRFGCYDGDYNSSKNKISRVSERRISL